MDTKEMQDHSGCGWCGACGHRHGGHLIIKILVVLFVFWLGVQVGEIKSILRAGYTGGGYGYGMMTPYYYNERGQAYYGLPGMMGWASQSATTTKK